MNRAHLHTLATDIWRATQPDDPAATPYAQAERAFIYGESVSHRRAARWISSLHRYESFWDEHDRPPRENTRARHTLPGEERRLAEWARYQRRFEQRLNAYQRARLEVSPAFEWDPRMVHWQRRLVACHEHRRLTGDLPRLDSSDAAEFALARWLGRQLGRLQRGELGPAQAAQLNALLNPWGNRY